MIELDVDAFARARAAGRAALHAERRAVRQASAAAVEAARADLVARAAEVHGDGAAGARDAGRLEDLADRLAAAVDAFGAVVQRLEVSRDRAGVGPRASEVRFSAWDPARIRDILAESLADELFCPCAAALLLTLIRSRGS